MKEADVAGTAGLAALAICDVLLKALNEKDLLSSEEIEETLEQAIAQVQSKGDKGRAAAKLISHMQKIFV